MYNDSGDPDYIVGITRGGLVPAIAMSNRTGIPMHTIDIRLRDTGGLEDAWMVMMMNKSLMLKWIHKI